MARKNEVINKSKKKRKNLLKDQQAGNLIEYGLLIGFAIFLFLLLVVIVVQIIDNATGGVWKLEEFFLWDCFIPFILNTVLT